MKLFRRREHFLAARKFFHVTKISEKQMWVDARNFVTKIIEIGAILTIFELFEVFAVQQKTLTKWMGGKNTIFWRIQPIVPGFMLKPFTKRTFTGTFV